LIPLLWNRINQSQSENDDKDDPFEMVKTLFILIAQRASAKESIIGLQESLEVLTNQVATWDEREHEDADKALKEEDLVARNLSLMLDSFSYGENP
jgi:thymidylate synthase